MRWRLSSSGLAATGAAGRRVHVLVGTGHHSKARARSWRTA